MRSRRWILYIVILFAVIFVGFQVAWRVFSLDQRLSSLVIQEIETRLQGQASIEKVSVSIHSIDFHNVLIRLNNSLEEVRIKKLELGFSLFNFLKYNMNPVRFISDIIVNQPTIKIRAVSSKVAESSSRKINVDSLETTYEAKMVDLGFVGRLVLNRGQLIFRRRDSSEISLLSDLKGWISTTELEKSQLRMKGRLFASENDNVEIAGQANLITGQIDSVLLKIADNELSTSIPTLFPELFTITKGEIYGSAILKPSDTGQLMLHGAFRIENGQIALFNEKMQLANFQSRTLITNWNMEIQECSFLLDQSRVDVTGRVNNILSPTLDITVAADDIQTKNVVLLFDDYEKVPMSGNGRLEFKILDSAASPRIVGNFQAKHLKFSDVPLQAASLAFTYQDHILSWDELQFKYESLRCQNRGSLNISGSAPILKNKIKLEGDLKPFLKGILNPKLESFSATLSAAVSGSVDSLVGEGSATFVAQFPDSSKITLPATLRWLGNRLQFSCASPDSPFLLDAGFRYQNKNISYKGELTRFGGKLWKLTNLPFKSQLQQRLQLSLSIFGSPNYTVYQLRTHRTEFSGTSDILFQIEGFFNKKSTATHFYGDILYFPESGEKVPGVIDLTVSPQSIVLKKYELGDFYVAHGQLEKKDEWQIQGTFDARNADITYLSDGLFLQPNFNILGKLNGKIELSGTLRRPQLSAKLQLSDGIIRGNGYYHGETQLQMDGGQIAVENTRLFLEDKKLLDMIGTVNLKTKNLQLDIHGEDVDIQTLMGLIIPGSQFIRGKANFELSLQDSLANPDISGKIEAYSGSLFFVPFDTLKMSVGRDVSKIQDSTFAEFLEKQKGYPGLVVQKAWLSKGQQYVINGFGFLPFSTKRDLRFDIFGNGNAFAVLFSDLSFVQGSQSESSFTWGFGGTYDDVIYTHGTVSIKNGMLQLEDIAPIVENIEVEAVLEPLNQFLRFDRFSGTIHDKPFNARTRLDSFLVKNRLEPLVISSWGLNFGVVEVWTGEKGVPLHIPELMEDKEQGWFIVKGKKEGEKFYFSGPAEHPLARGKILAYDLQFSFPFAGAGDTTETDLTQKILESMLWDVELEPLSDVRYVKKLPGLIDNVRISATIDPKVSKLHFTGIVADESFRAEGIIESTRGTIEYLDLNFSLEKFGAEFDRSDIYPVVYGRARTTVSDSVGFPSNIYMTLYVYDRETKQELERGRWSDDIRFRLSSDNPTLGTNEGQILAALGYSLDTVNSAELLGTSTDNMIFRPLLRPVERRLERSLGLDVVRLRAHFARNVMDVLMPRYGTRSPFSIRDPNMDIDPRYLLFRSTQLMIGKYLSNNLYFLYSGQLDAGRNPQYIERGLGIRHTFDLEYRILPNLLLELQYNYDSLLQSNKDDKRIQIRHSFKF